LMGEPAARWYAAQPHAAFVPAQIAATASKPANGEAATTPYNGGARLVPDFGAPNPYQAQTSPASPQPAPELLPQTHAGGEAMRAVQDVAANVDPPLAHTSFRPLAKLRDEAPRPLDIERRAPAATHGAPSITSQRVETASIASTSTTSTDWRTSALTPAGFAYNGESAATISASYSPPVEMPRGEAAIAPPPWPAPDEDRGPRTHIIVDGDSLERLAGRYLDDPHRSDEIYQANRELLPSPDLLPIGAELVIPTRRSAPAFDASSPQSSVPPAVAIHAATRSGLVPVRPIPSTAGVMPRAQLLRPLPVGAASRAAHEN
jgi:nucleoid-associated protein YgaU